jgi:predicted RNase H-like nuclease (RuvC/YqgF family)
MTPKKAAEQSDPQMPLGGSKDRKPWVKRTPVEAVLRQIERLHEGLANKEEELKHAKRQLQKLEDVRKILESA